MEKEIKEIITIEAGTPLNKALWNNPEAQEQMYKIIKDMRKSMFKDMAQAFSENELSEFNTKSE